MKTLAQALATNIQLADGVSVAFHAPDEGQRPGTLTAAYVLHEHGLAIPLGTHLVSQEMVQQEPADVIAVMLQGNGTSLLEQYRSYWQRHKGMGR